RSASRKMSCIFLDDNNSAGFGGMGPQDNTYKSSTSVTSIASPKLLEPTNTLLNPVKLFKRNVYCTVGFLKSASTNNVFNPCCAYVTAKFADVMDFPAAGPAEVTNIDCKSPSTDENCKFVPIV